MKTTLDLDDFLLPVLRRTGGLRPGIDPTFNRSLFEAAGDALPPEL